MEEKKKEFGEDIAEEEISGKEEEEMDSPAEEAVTPAEESGEEPVERPQGKPAEEQQEEAGEEEPRAAKEKKKKKSAKVLEMELQKSEAKALELTDKYQRLMAEFENARKRNAKEQNRMYDVGAREVLGKLLPVVDNFERGLGVLTEEEKEGAFAQGIEKIYQQLMEVFSEIGVTAMDAVGKEFNPDYHNAVMHAEDDSMGENLVAEEFQKGYMYKDSVLRHSMVKVVN